MTYSMNTDRKTTLVATGEIRAAQIFWCTAGHMEELISVHKILVANFKGKDYFQH
jgi:hypothetical protein